MSYFAGEILLRYNTLEASNAMELYCEAIANLLWNGYQTRRHSGSDKYRYWKLPFKCSR